MKRRLLLVSNSTLHGGGYLEHCQQQIKEFFGQQVKRILFIPYALHDHDAYAKTARDKLKSLGYDVDSVHETADPVQAVRRAEGIFIGGGNTFRLLKSLYDNNLVTEIRTRVLQQAYGGEDGARSRQAQAALLLMILSGCQMPNHHVHIHYWETREQRITQFHEEPETPCVLGLREGSMLLVEGQKATLLGSTKARLFQRGKVTVDYEPGTDLSWLLTDAH
ncbi:alpha-aspartyl dipeptidase isoform X2 [Brachyhypopomus gauderio]|uniref:alpha-aspartyl dipeptidase isoform X2 n=1 Tax=Brachyhypopomus gauderio TaxID=698409 RepID=UPI004041928C